MATQATVPCGGSAPRPHAGAQLQPPIPLGQPIPADMDHAVSVSLPHWQDVVDYEEGRIGDKLVTGYPRFFIHRTIQQLANVMQSKFARPGEAAMLFPSATAASQCRDFICAKHAEAHRAQGARVAEPVVRIVRFGVLAHEAPEGGAVPTLQGDAANATAPIMLHVVLFPPDLFPLAKNFWQHTGMGISSRLAEESLRVLAHNRSLLPEASREIPMPGSSTRGGSAGRGGGGFGRSRYQRAVPGRDSPTTASPAPADSAAPAVLAERAKKVQEGKEDELTLEHAMYVEERFGRNLPFGMASRAKLALRRRIAGTLLSDHKMDDQIDRMTGDETVAPNESVRQVPEVSENDVYLYPCGMASIFDAHQTLMLERALTLAKGDEFTEEDCAEFLRTSPDPSFVRGPYPIGKSVCFGFPYTDTLKLLQKWGPGCHFYGHGTDEDLDALEAQLAQQPADEPRIVALYCEFPSNPLLRSPDLPRLRRLADTYGFSIVVDDTIGNFVNVEVLPYADIVVSSLTKVFSGECNVMGGSLVLNPHSARAASVRRVLRVHYQDVQWPEDAIFLERNSRDFVTRVARIDHNTETLCTYLREQMSPQAVVRDVMYPKYVTPAHYETCRRKQPYAADGRPSGYGGLFSVVFSSKAAAKAFYDNLSCAKGPSLGTNCTLACPYTLIAHYGELEWAAQMDVPTALVRVSVGLEETGTLLAAFRDALAAAERADADAARTGTDA